MPTFVGSFQSTVPIILKKKIEADIVFTPLGLGVPHCGELPSRGVWDGQDFISFIRLLKRIQLLSCKY